MVVFEVYDNGRETKMLIQLVAERNDTLGLTLKQTWKWRPLENEFSHVPLPFWQKATYNDI